MLDAHREQAFGFQGEGLAVAIQRLDANVFRPRHRLVEAGHGEAAFVALLLALRQLDHRIDERQRLIPSFGHVHHQHTLVDIHLGGGKADAGRRVHGLEQVVDEAHDRLVHRRHRSGLGAQARVGIAENGERGHEPWAAISTSANHRIGELARVSVGNKEHDRSMSHTAKGESRNVPGSRCV